MARTARTLLVALVALAAAAPVPADVLCLKDGRVLDGPRMERVDEGIRVHFESGQVLVPAALVLDALIEGDAAFVPRTDEEREMHAKGLVPFDGRWVAPKRREELIQQRLEEKRAALADLIAHREWRNRHQEETRSFRFQHTVPKHIFEDYRDKMEAYFQVFAKEWKIRTSSKQKLNVCFYGDRREFQRTAGAGPWVLGYFKFVGEYDLNVYYDRLDPAETEDVMFHEANHYLQKLIDEGFSYPHWPGEALAEYYGASEWDPEEKELRTGLIQEGRLVEVLSDVAGGKWMGLRELITTDGMYEHYTWGWTLVHFLMHDPRHSKKFQKFFLALASGRDVRREEGPFGLRTVAPEAVYEAFCSYLGLRTEDDVRALEKDWHAYVGELRHESTSGLEKAAVAALREGRKLRAKRLFEEALGAGSTSPFLRHRYAELLHMEGDRPGAIERWREAIALDPLTGEYYLGLAAALRPSDPDESKRLLALAKEIDPEADASPRWE